MHWLVVKINIVVLEYLFKKLTKLNLNRESLGLWSEGQAILDSLYIYMEDVPMFLCIK